MIGFDKAAGEGAYPLISPAFRREETMALRLTKAQKEAAAKKKKEEDEKAAAAEVAKQEPEDAAETPPEDPPTETPKEVKKEDKDATKLVLVKLHRKLRISVDGGPCRSSVPKDTKVRVEKQEAERFSEDDLTILGEGKTTLEEENAKAKKKGLDPITAKDLFGGD